VSVSRKTNDVTHLTLIKRRFLTGLTIETGIKRIDVAAIPQHREIRMEI
jgi:hypothetical protein